MRALTLEVRYEGREEPSISTPVLDFFGLPHGRPVAYHSMLTTAQEGRGFNSYLPMPFRERIEIAFTNHSDIATMLYYQVDYTLQPEVPAELGYLHVAFRRENPTVQKRDFVIAEGLRRTGPVPRLRGGRAGDRPRQLVRRGRGQDLHATATPTSPRSAAPGWRTTSARRGAWASTTRPTRARTSC